MPPATGPGDGSRRVAYSVGGLILAVALATGPVGLVTIPEGGFGAGTAPGEGTATIHIRSTPEMATFSAGKYSDVHYLSVPAIKASVTGVTGKPLVTASVSIDALGLQRSSVFTLSDRSDPARSFEIDRSAVESARLNESEYRGTLRVVLRESAGETVVYDGPITIRVRE